MDAPVLSRRLFVFCAVPLAVVIVSWVLRRAWQIRTDWYIADRPPCFTPLDVSTIRFTGRALALTVGTVGGIGLVRSYISVVALGPDITGVGRGPSAFFLYRPGLAFGTPDRRPGSHPDDRFPCPEASLADSPCRSGGAPR